MVFKKISDIQPPTEHLYKALKQKLGSGQKVAWVITGGSSMTIVLAVAKKLEGLSLKNLSIFLTDERYGPIGHSNSNWSHLEKNGFKLSGTRLIPTLVNRTLDETVQLYEKTVGPFLSDSSVYKLAMAGIGADGHTFGIKPKSPAVFSKELVSGYRGDDFVRITLTPNAIKMMDEIVVYATGQEKQPVLDDLDNNISIVRQPAQALKQVKNLTIYNDYKGETT